MSRKPGGTLAEMQRRIAIGLLALVMATACSDESAIGDSSTTPNPSASSSIDTTEVVPDSAPAAVPTPTTTPTTVSATPLTPTTINPRVELGVVDLVRSDFAALDGRRVGLITNSVSMVDGTHLIDWMAEASNVELVRIFAAEHGVRGVAGAGELIGDGVDDTTGVPIRSLYGATRQPTPDMLEGIDTIVFDLQDVGTRYYTYTATMGLAMQAAAAADVAFVVLDRPNPLGRIVEGDLRTDQQASFISQYPTPSLHGLTAGELALMIVGEAWLPGLDGLELDIIEMTGWDGAPWRRTGLQWFPPSPGLQTMSAGLTYPATVWFEATTLSYGAGTGLAFQAVGAPWLDAATVVADLESRALVGVSFEVVELSPVDTLDVAIDPRLEGETFPGVRVVITDPTTFTPSAVGLHMLEAIIDSAPGQTVIDRGAVFDLLAGTSDVRRQLLAGTPVEEITADWADIAAAFEARSFAYLLY